jgi:hypothetical protein
MSAGNLEQPFRAIAILALGALATACVDYKNHYEGVTYRGGDATYANAAIQTIDPWPPESDRTTVYSLGKRSPKVIQSYIGQDTDTGTAASAN